jgi:hypothetical protein
VNQYKLGRQPHDPTRKAIELEDILTGELLPVPPSVDYQGGLKFGEYMNNRFGICGPTSVANFCRLVSARLTGKMVAPTQEDVNKLYRESGNPGFNPDLSPDDPRQDDNGVNMQTMLQAWLKNDLGPFKLLGFARVNVKKPEVMHAAVALFGGQLLGVTLQDAQKSQTDRGYWDYSPSGEWGGHAVLEGAHNKDKVVTWAREVEVKPAFVQHQLDEAWVPILPLHLTDYGFVKGVDVGRMAQAFGDLTGKKFPVDVSKPLDPSDFDVIGKRD